MGKFYYQSAIFVASVAPMFWCMPAWAQSEDPGDVAVPQSGPGGGNSTSTTSTTQTFTPWGASFDPGQPSEGGTYGFDLQRSGGSATVRGNQNGSFMLTSRAAGVPTFHTVRRGDTLWDLCDRYYDNPYAWPRVWSYNPQIENPHWIYPGDRIRMRSSGVVEEDQSHMFVRRQVFVPSGTVFLRDYGYVGDDSEDAWGSIVGSPDDQMLLSDGDDAYIKIGKDHDVRVGERLSVFRATRKPEAGDSKGQIVHIKGTVQIRQWNAETRIARVRIVESVDVIERGDKVGPADRRFDVVAPVRNDLDVWAKITGGLRPHELIGQHQVVLIDKGEKDGLRPGNRLFVVAKGDRWNASIRYGRRTAAATVQLELHGATVSEAPDTSSGEKLPTEVVGEVRVLRVRKHSAICLVTFTEFELEPGQLLLARRGY